MSPFRLGDSRRSPGRGLRRKLSATSECCPASATGRGRRACGAAATARQSARSPRPREARPCHRRSGSPAGSRGRPPRRRPRRQMEDQEHLGGPAADPLDLDQLGDHVLVGQVLEAVEIEPAVLDARGEVSEVLDLRVGEAGLEQGRRPLAQQLLGGGRPAAELARAACSRSTAPPGSRAAGRRSPGPRASHGSGRLPRRSISGWIGPVLLHHPPEHLVRAHQLAVVRAPLRSAGFRACAPAGLGTIRTSTPGQA